MKCPSCGDATDQLRLESPADSLCYRCGRCGRIYQVPIVDLATMIHRLEELKANADWLATQHAQFAERIAEFKAQIEATRGE